MDNESQIIADLDREILKEEQRIEDENKQVLIHVKGIVSQRDYEAILEDIKESGYTYDYKLTNDPKGSIDDDLDPYEHGHRYVNQTTNGGYSGDSYAGEVYIPISQVQWLQFSYSM